MRRLGAAAIAATLVLAGCSGGSGPEAKENPKDALLSALENVSKRDGHAITVSLDATAESVQALDSKNGETGMTLEDAQKIVDSSVQILSKGNGEDAQVEVVVTIAGEDDLAMKVVDQVLYLQADAEGIAETFGGDPSQLDVVARQAEAQGLDFVRPALEGQWIAIAGGEQLQQQIGGGSTDDTAAQQEEFFKDLTQAFRETAEVEHVGTEDAGEHLAASLSVKDLYSKVLGALRARLGSAAGFTPLPAATDVPDETVVLDVWVEDDRVSQVAFDLAQIERVASEAEENAADRAALVIALDDFEDEVEPPEDAVEVEAQQLFQLLAPMMFPGAGGMGNLGGTKGGASGSSGEFDCSQLKGAPPSILKKFADECPELQNQ